MLLIPFIENSFKHGLQGAAGALEISILIKISSTVLDFSISNTTGNGEAFELEKRKGIGIENTRQRLELLYPGKHTLNIGKDNQVFVVSLKLELI